MNVPTAPPERLATMRVLVGCFAVLYLVVQVRAFLVPMTAAPSRFQPVGVLRPLRSPLPDAIVVAAYALGIVTGLCYVAGTAFRLTGPVFAVLLLGLTTYRSSWGQVLWLENLMVLHVAIVALAPSADVMRWRSRGHPSVRRNHEVYGMPLRLAALVTAATYVVAAVTKLRTAGLDWATTDSLRNHVAATVVRSDLLGTAASPIGRWLVSVDWVFRPLATLALLLELAAPIALIGGRARDLWVLLTWLMHAAIALVMFVVFPYPLFLVAFAPFYELERVTRVWHRWGSRQEGDRDDAQLRVRSIG